MINSSIWVKERYLKKNDNKELATTTFSYFPFSKHLITGHLGFLLDSKKLYGILKWKKSI